ncbi:MAG TPA: hypothetical protein VGX68_22775, partial [Thermoanaerobaculia bacterium]|nr:hypothetical protein [Thermoanaerobaculia bacterium]
MKGRLVGVVMAASVAACSVSHARIERTVVTQYGLFAMENPNVQAAPVTAAGKVYMGQKLPTLITITDRVPRKRGTAFGYQFVVEGEPK